MTITTKTAYGKEDIFEVVDKIPALFFVWNIGDNMGHDDYIPLCEALNTGICSINPDTLKAIKLDKAEVLILRKAAGYGVNSKETALRALNKAAKSTMQKTTKQLAEKALPIFERIAL